MNKKKTIAISCTTLLIALLATAYYILNPLLPIITGYGAKSMCSGVFVAHRNADSIRAIDVNFSPINLSNIQVNYEEQSVESRFLWHTSKAIYREGWGATLVCDANPTTLRQQKINTAEASTPLVSPLTPASSTHIDTLALNEIAQELISDRSYGGTPFSIAILHKGQLALEAYKPGFDRDTRVLSWSMAKSFTNAMAGIMVKNHQLDIYAPCGFDEWNTDQRRNITINDLMQMQSGLEWNENYGSESDVNLMLHTTTDMAAYTMAKPAENAAGTHWKYSSGSINLLSYALRRHLDNDSTYYAVAYEQLFKTIGANTAIFEADPSGTLIGSSYIYARTIDFARFGQLYLDNGVIDSTRVFPQGWVEYTTTPASASEGRYGSCFWLGGDADYESLPADLYACRGHDGQHIIIIPSHDLVIATLGYSPKKRNPLDIIRLTHDIISTIK